MTALEKHAIRYRMRGIPIDETGEVIEEPLWDQSQLSKEDELVLGKAVIAAMNDPERLNRKDYFTDEKTWAVVMEEFGIRCWHPVQWRVNLGGGTGGYECRACSSYIMPKVNYGRD